MFSSFVIKKSNLRASIKDVERKLQMGLVIGCGNDLFVSTNSTFRYGEVCESMVCPQ